MVVEEENVIPIQTYGWVIFEAFYVWCIFYYETYYQIIYNIYDIIIMCYIKANTLQV
jgi:hypothetical protein